jgi:hypothetical protein
MWITGNTNIGTEEQKCGSKGNKGKGNKKINETKI